ncbi:fumarylacetoacetate hydrolase family protein [Roseobacter sp. YSTF-M11]|uniref:Fumarylacetoacetate hydrolase family protein n=1 Tax=Roseobacter insulae TaxID=2859783 RepID=A0A9X1FRB4_9RHOB|nr:fumarylacetoacetate hydrolase family protein [Roseobacter insulae]MBW4706356.1 fumarylacetoacetate hydrolase family protein [Roseobacter insulae]
MKIVRWGKLGQETFGIIDDSRIADLSEVSELDGIAPFTSDWFAAIRTTKLDTLPTVEDGVRIGACIPRPGTLLCIGLNYSDHAAEAGMSAPAEPVMFMKASNAITGPFDPVPMPAGTLKLDWEVELGVVIGTGGSNIARADALAHVAGYCTVNDLSARDWQLEGTGQWVKGKSFPGAAPVGPWLVTPDEVGDPQSLSLSLQVDGSQRQSGSTRKMIFDVATIIAEASRYMALEPGDLIATGTPAGVGMGHTPPVYLRAGQRVRTEVEGLGAQDVMITAKAG